MTKHHPSHEQSQCLDPIRALRGRADPHHQAARAVPRAGARCERAHLAGPSGPPGGAPDLPPLRNRSGPRTGLVRLHRFAAVLQPRGHAAHLLHPAVPGQAAAQSPAVPGRLPRARLQHRRELHHQHQLAELRRRIDHVVFLADGGAGLPQLHLGRRRHRHRRGPGARHRPPDLRRPSATSGSMSSGSPTICSSRSASSLPCCSCPRE